MNYPMTQWFNSPVETDLTIFYNSDYNKFVDERGTILFNINHLISFWQLEEAKKIGRTEGYAIVVAKDNRLVEIFFPEDWYELLDWESIDEYHNEQMEMYGYRMNSR